MPLLDPSAPRVSQDMETGARTFTDPAGNSISKKVVDEHNRSFATETPAEPAKVEEKPAEVKEKTINPEAEARKLFLQAQKAERKAKEMEKKAAAGLQKAQAIETAIKMTKEGEDPTALLTAVGIDPVKFYQDMTTFALSDKAPKVIDPVQKELQDHRDRLDKYAKDLEVQANTLKEKEELSQHNANITAQVVPLLTSNPDRYESLLLEYGSNAAVEIYKAVWDRYQQTGEVVSFEQAANKMEEYWSNQIESGIVAASKMKKFAARFAQQAAPRETKVDQETPNRSFTLSNKNTSTPAPVASTTKRRSDFETEDEYVKYVVKKHGGFNPRFQT